MVKWDSYSPIALFFFYKGNIIMIRRRKRQHKAQPEPKTREQLEREHGQVWDTAELAKEFVVTSIIRPLIVVRRKADDVVGTLTVQEKPRLYLSLTSL